MNDNKGWIKFHRKLLSNKVFRYDPTAWRVFEVLLLLADSKTGELTIGREQLAGWTGLKPTTAYNAMLRLKKAQMIDSTSNNKFTQVLICKWREYQSPSNSTDDNEMTTNRQPNDTLQEVRSKKENISIDIDIAPLPPLSEESKEDWDYWEKEMAPITRNQIFHRNALIRMRKLHGKDRLYKMIRLAAAAHSEGFVSATVKCNSPTDLEKKWDALAIWGKGKFNQQHANQPI